MKKKALIMALALCLACSFTLVGCKGLLGGAGKVPEFEASIEKVFTTGNYDGSTLLVINLNITNNSDLQIPSAGLGFNASATLDGKTLSEDFLGLNHPEAVDMTATIAAKSQGIGQLVYKLPETEGVVELVISPNSLDYSKTIEVLRESIDLSKVEAVVSESGLDITVNSVTLTDDGEGKSLVVLDITFTNNSKEALSFGGAINTELFQNNIGLKSGYLPYNHPMADNDLNSNSYVDIKQGASINLIEVFELLDDTNPVELTCADYRSYDQAVILSKTIEIAGSAPVSSAA